MFQNTGIHAVTPAVIGTSPTTVYTSPDASTRAIFNTLDLYNDSGSTVVIQIWVIPHGDSASLANKRATIDIKTKQTYQYDLPFVVEPQGLVVVEADTGSAVSVNGSYAEFQDVS